MPETAGVGTAEMGTLITFAPAPGPIGHLLRTAIDSEQVGATRLHLAADQRDMAAAIAALREQTKLVLTCDIEVAGVDLIGSEFVDAVVEDGGDLPGVVAKVATLVSANPGGVAIYGRGRATLPALLAALAAGGHVFIEAPEYVAAQHTGRSASAKDHGSARDHAALVARASGLARIAGRPPLDRRAARTLLGIG